MPCAWRNICAQTLLPEASMPDARRVGVVYGAGILQGAAFVLVPSLGSILAVAPYHFSAQAYGLLYFPEIGGAVLGALLAGRLQQRTGSPAVLRSGLAINAIGMSLLVLASLTEGRLAYGAILLETLCLGVGFGLTLSTLNPYASLLFPDRPTTAITMLNGLIGAATALAPLALHAFAASGHWGMLPLFLLLGFAGLILIKPPAHKASPTGSMHRGMVPFALAVLIYAVAEGSFSSWAQIYVGSAQHATQLQATLALSLFWGGMTVTRLLLGLVPEHGPARRMIFIGSALGIGASLALLAMANDALFRVVLYAVAGVACSIYYPYAMAYGLRAWPRQDISLAGLLVAALMAGEGIGSLAPGSLHHILPLSSQFLGLGLLGLPLLYFAWHLPRRIEPGTGTGP
jgi:fucose permease